MTSPRRLDRAPRGAFTPAGCLVCSRGRRASLAAQGVRCRGAAWLPRGVGGLSAAARSPQAAGAAARRRDRSGAGGRLTPDWQPARCSAPWGTVPRGRAGLRAPRGSVRIVSSRCLAAALPPSSPHPASLNPSSEPVPSEVLITPWPPRATSEADAARLGQVHRFPTRNTRLPCCSEMSPVPQRQRQRTRHYQRGTPGASPLCGRIVFPTEIGLLFGTKAREQTGEAAASIRHAGSRC